MTKVGQGGQYQLLLGVRHLGLSFSTWTVSDDFVESDAQVLGRQLLRRVRCLGFPGAESGVGRSLVSRRTDEAGQWRRRTFPPAQPRSDEAARLCLGKLSAAQRVCTGDPDPTWINTAALFPPD